MEKVLHFSFILKLFMHRWIQDNEVFLFHICFCKPLWTMKSFIETATEEIREKVGKKKVVCGISGGVDSTVTAAARYN
jgi:hypothetical protein